MTTLDSRMKNLIQDILDEAAGDPKMRRNTIRLEADAKMAEEAGFALPPPVYTLGTPVNDIGQGNFRASRVSWENLPDAKKAAKVARAMILSEERRDIVAPPQSMWCDRSGDISVIGNGRFKITRGAMQQLASFVAPPGSYAGSYLTKVDQDHRAWCLNKHLSAPKSDKEIKLRVRKDGDDQVIFAVVSKTFSDYNVVNVLEDIEGSIPEDAKGSFIYSGDGGKMIFDATYHSNIFPEDAAAGEIFRVGTRISTADDGTQSYRVSMLAERNLCLNFIVIGKDEVHLFRSTHRGDSVKIRESLRNAIVMGMGRLDGFAKKWSHSRKTVIPAETRDQIVQVYQGLIDAKYLKATGKDAAENFATAWLHEPGTTMADLVNGVTRFARDRSWNPSQWADSAELEVAAGELLYATVNWNRVL